MCWCNLHVTHTDLAVFKERLLEETNKVVNDFVEIISKMHTGLRGDLS